MNSQKCSDVAVANLPITLGKFLKLAGAAETGNAAKLLIHQEKVTVNGIVTVQRGKKLFDNDQVGIEEMVFRVVDRDGEHK